MLIYGCCCVFYYIYSLSLCLYGYYTLKSSFKIESEENETKRENDRMNKSQNEKKNEKPKLVLYVDC